ncbi:MAG: hypothetical protein R3F59_18505 [Myxococcota bacterium]
MEGFRLDEDRIVRELGFRFAEESRPVAAVRSAAPALYYYPPEHVLDSWAQVAPLAPSSCRPRSIRSRPTTCGSSSPCPTPRPTRSSRSTTCPTRSGR